MMEAEEELLVEGVNAIPLLAELLEGTARNVHGVPYRALGLPLRCAVEVSGRLGPAAKPLERLLLDELARGYVPAAMALGRLGTLEERSVRALASCLESSDADIVAEVAVALINCGRIAHPAVVRITGSSKRAAIHVLQMQHYLARQNFIASLPAP